MFRLPIHIFEYIDFTSLYLVFEIIVTLVGFLIAGHTIALVGEGRGRGGRGGWGRGRKRDKNE